MESPLGLTLIDPGKLPPIVTSPTYTEIFNSTLGTAATDADGVPLRLADLADRAAAFQADVTAGDGDLNDTLTAGGAHDTTTADALAASVPQVTAAGEPLLGVVDKLAAGQFTPGGGTGGGGTGVGGTPVSTALFKAADFPGVKCTVIVSLFNMRVGQPPQLNSYGDGAASQAGVAIVGATLLSGDPGMFKLATHMTGFAGAQNQGFLDITVTPKSSGRFTATIQTRYTGGPAPATWCVGVAIQP